MCVCVTGEGQLVTELHDSLMMMMMMMMMMMILVTHSVTLIYVIK
jgi:hypothetical protein